MNTTNRAPRFLERFLKSVDADSEEQLRLQHYTVFVMLGVPIMAAFTVFHLALAEYALAAVIMVPAVSLGGGWLFVLRGKGGLLVYRVNVLLFAVLILCFLVLGGAAGSQILWMYTFPLVAFFIFGVTEGLIWNSILFAFSLFFLTTPPGREIAYQYPTAVVVRFILSFLAVSVIACWLEYFRGHYRSGMEAEQAELVKERQRLTELVAERESAKQALQESEERFRTLSDAALEGLAISEDGRILDANLALLDMVGYELEELIGRNAVELVPPEDRQLVTEKVRSGNEELYEHKVLRKDGSVINVEVRGHSISYQGRSARVAAVRDITKRQRDEEERRRLELQVQHAQKLESLGVLAGGIAHDFNNLLMGVLGNAELAVGNLPPEHPARENIERAIKAAQRAAELAGQMLAYSGEGKFVIEPIDVTHVVGEMVQLATASVKKGTTLSCELDENLPTIHADASQVGQVVMNLITNASEALGADDGVVSVTTGREECDRACLNRMNADAECVEGTYVFVRVSDAGVGMDADTVGKMFDPFFSTKFIGRGLGLAVVLGIVRGHKGAITVDSEPGRGTTVTAYFPVTDEKPPPPSRQASVVHATLPSGITVLLVDDEDAVLEVVRALLESAGFQVKTARNGSEGLEVFKKHADEIDCVLLDLTMPKMDGAAMFEELRRIASDVPVLLASGYSKSEVEVRFGDRGFAGFIQKPFSLGELKRKISEVMG